MSDATETIRREHAKQINHDPGSREDMESKHGQVWNTKELQQDFEVLSFLAPYVTVRRKSDNQMGSLAFQHDPRFYYNFKEEDDE
jgi:hypothetical protein